MDALEDVFAVADMRTNKSDAFFPVILFFCSFSIDFMANKRKKRRKMREEKEEGRCSVCEVVDN